MFASGNGGHVDDDCSADGYCTNINTIAIGSASVDGMQAPHDESCSCKMAVNFASGNSSLGVVGDGLLFSQIGIITKVLSLCWQTKQDASSGQVFAAFSKHEGGICGGPYTCRVLPMCSYMHNS